VPPLHTYIERVNDRSNGLARSQRDERLELRVKKQRATLVVRMGAENEPAHAEAASEDRQHRG
jgi:hypothetical protein